MSPARTRESTPADAPALAALWAECFDAPQIAALHALDPDRHRRTFVAEGEAGALDAVVVWVPRTVRDAHGVPERVGGVGSVATRPSARGRGLVRRLLADAERSMTAERCAWSLLFTDTPGVYRGSGWREFPRLSFEGPIAVAGTAPGPCPVRPATPADAEAVRALHTAYNADRPLTTVRSAADWALRVPVWYGAPGTALIAEDPATGEAVGWLVAEYGGERAEVREFAGREACLPALFAAVAAGARAAGLRRAGVHLPDGAGLRTALPALLAEAAPVEDRTGMARPMLAPAAAVRAVLTAPGAVHWYGDSF
ncbi:GNAT family N-acetyltransferase [uncultured Streptomyces sp.]|uniref:GNAT family N-acetyltransferase n=1 Tax=uncultured Streptomyces sp. TaxID=174707 RepID=UPI002634A5FF|nr:GNAT family N-acetyltransferase [uncultured Streptomyces sp.]